VQQSEKVTRDLIKRFCLKAKIFIWSNVRGNAFFGKPIVQGRDVLIQNFRRVECGLAPGASDFIGITEVVITEEMVGRKVGIFTALEAKKSAFKRTGSAFKRTGSDHDTEQQNFIKVVRDAGGIAGFVRNQDDLEMIFRNFL
jgi:hypothetical protein